jgi:hypothetical protein
MLPHAQQQNLVIWSAGCCLSIASRQSNYWSCCTLTPQGNGVKSIYEVRHLQHICYAKDEVVTGPPAKWGAWSLGCEQCSSHFWSNVIGRRERVNPWAEKSACRNWGSNSEPNAWRSSAALKIPPMKAADNYLWSTWYHLAEDDSLEQMHTACSFLQQISGRRLQQLNKTHI